MQRRSLLALGLAGALPCARAQGAPSLLTRPIPSSGERLPAVGLGTWLTFDVSVHDRQAIARRRAVVERFLADGGRLVDSSPMYGHAEAVMGEVLANPEPRVF